MAIDGQTLNKQFIHWYTTSDIWSNSEQGVFVFTSIYSTFLCNTTKTKFTITAKEEYLNDV